MQKWVLQSGSLNNLSLKELPIPKLNYNGEIIVKVSYVGLNFADIFACLGLYSATPKDEFTPGLEFSGIIQDIIDNDDSHSFKIGDKVMGVTRFGGYSSHIKIHAGYLRLLPNNWSLQEGASFLCQSLTAWYGLVQLGGLNPPNIIPSKVEQAFGKKIVLIQSAAGGVGLWALNICKICNAYPIAVVGNDIKKQFLINELELNENQIIVRSKNPNEFNTQIIECLSWISELQEFINKDGIDGIDIIFDAVACDYFMPSYTTMSRGGRYIIYGAAQYMSSCGDKPNYLSLGWKYIWRPKLDPMEMITQNKAVLGFNLIWMWDKVELMKNMLEDMMNEENIWKKPKIHKIYKFNNVLEALKTMQTGKTIGKIILEIEK